MAENSETSATSGKRSTRATAKLTPDQALQILQEAATRCREAGLQVQIASMFDRGTQTAAIVITGAEWRDENLIVAINGKVAE